MYVNLTVFVSAAVFSAPSGQQGEGKRHNAEKLKRKNSEESWSSGGSVNRNIRL